MDSLTWTETQQDVPSAVTYQEVVDRRRAYIERVRREPFNLAGTSQQLVTNVRTAPKQRAPRKAKGVVAPSRHSARQLELAPANYTVDSEAADKLFFSSIMSAPPTSAKPCKPRQRLQPRSQCRNQRLQNFSSLRVALQLRKIHSRT